MVENFQVGEIGPWSDHAPLVLKLCIPKIPVVTNPGLPYIRNKLREAAESHAYLDVLLRDSLESKKSSEEKRAGFYGPVHHVGNAVKVYSDGSCFGNGTPAARAGAGVYYGPGSPFNVSMRVTGEQTNNRGELLAILHAVSTVPLNKSLELYSDSTYSIRSIVYLAPGHAEKGWKCTNADLLQDITGWVKSRSAPIHFKYVKAHSGNGHNDGADAAAKDGA
ncbi:ribonuclease H-like domain-containing protein, partial [Mycena filopes]